MQKYTLVFVHGMFCYGWVWKNFQKYFSDLGYSCIVIDLPYHRLEDQNKQALAKIGFLDYVQHVKKIVEEISDDYVLVGHSMGALISQKVAMLVSNKPKMLISLATAAQYGVLALEPSVIKSFIDILISSGFWKKSHRMSKEKILFSMLNKMPTDVATEMCEKIHLGYESGRVIFQIGIWPLDFKFSTWISPKRIHCPIIHFSGDEDNITPHKVNLNVAKKLRYKCGVIRRLLIRAGLLDGEKYDRLKFVRLLGKGHWLLAEPGWQRICEDIVTELDKIKFLLNNKSVIYDNNQTKREVTQ